MSNCSVTAAQTADRLRQADRILILTHQYPDGDTLGSAAALCHALQRLGKQARVMCHDDIPDKYAYLFDGLADTAFEPAYICAVDVADGGLLGERLQPYADRIDLCIDHHGSHTLQSEYLMLDAQCAATAMLVCDVVRALGVPLDTAVAQAVYTGIATDTGCFRNANVSAEALRMAADMFDVGIPFVKINRAMFDVKSRARVELERMALDGIRFYHNGRVAVMPITQAMLDDSGACEGDLEGLAPLPRQIEGVWVGVTLRQKPDGAFKVSVRTGTHANAATICKLLGGGGHAGAAGCTVDGPLDHAIEQLLDAIGRVIGV